MDSSSLALDLLFTVYNKEVEEEQLELIEEDVATFTSDEMTDLVIATDVLPYTDPSQFRATWTKIHDTLIKEKGFLIGTLFRSAPTHNEVQLMNGAKEMGAWLLPDSRMVKPLLKQTGYKIISCQYRPGDPQMAPTCIEFLAQKKS